MAPRPTPRADITFPEPPRPVEEPPWMANYCEENIYHLVRWLTHELEAQARSKGKDRACKTLNGKAGVPVGADAFQIGDLEWRVWVVFISNANKSAVLWHQAASHSPELDYRVCWDYHVVAAVSCWYRPGTTPASLRRQASSQYGVDSTRSYDRFNAHGRVSAYEETYTRLFGGDQGAGRRYPLLEVPTCRVSASAAEPAGRTNAPMAGGSDGFDGAPNANGKAAQPEQADDLRRCWVYDLDSRLGLITGFAKYVSKTFRPELSSMGVMPAELQSRFRVIPASIFLSHFASDRSHMLDKASLPPDFQACTSPPRPLSNNDGDGGMKFVYRSPPPFWPSIAGDEARRKGWAMNLMDGFVDMQEEDVDRLRGVEAIQRMIDEFGLETEEEVEDALYGGLLTGAPSSTGDGVAPTPDLYSTSPPFGLLLSPPTFYSLAWIPPPLPPPRPPSTAGPRASRLPPDLRKSSGRSVIQTSTGNGKGAESPQRRPGGRVSHPLFTAYMFASYEAKIGEAPPAGPA